MNWLDLGLIIFVIIFLIIGIKKGFMSSVLSNFTLGTVAIIAFFLCKPISHLLNNWFHLENAIFNSYYAKFAAKSSNFEINLLTLEESDLLPFVRSTLSLGGIPAVPRLMFKWFIANRSLYSKLHGAGIESRTLGQIVSSSYASFFVSLIAFAITFVLIYLIVLIFKLVIDKLRKNGFIKGVDSILGAVYGIGRALIILIIICVIIKLLSPISFMKGVTDYISSSFFGKLVYEQINNLLENYLNYDDIIHEIFKT